MASRRYNVDEGRRLLPQLVRTIASEGGRGDITHRGEPRVTLLRTSDVHAKVEAGSRGLPRALRVDLSFPVEELREVLVQGRRQTGESAWLTEEPRKTPEIRGRAKAKWNLSGDRARETATRTLASAARQAPQWRSTALKHARFTTIVKSLGSHPTKFGRNRALIPRPRGRPVVASARQGMCDA